MDQPNKQTWEKKIKWGRGKERKISNMRNKRNGKVSLEGGKVGGYISLGCQGVLPLETGFFGGGWSQGKCKNPCRRLGLLSQPLNTINLVNGDLMHVCNVKSHSHSLNLPLWFVAGWIMLEFFKVGLEG